MSVILKRLYEQQGNPYRLSLAAGRNSVRNTVTWVHMVEDEYIIKRFRGCELAVTTGLRASTDPEWLMKLVVQLSERQAAGLIVNTGKFILEIPSEVLDYCDSHDFPLFTMPWEIHMADMIRSFCTMIIYDQQETLIHDKAMWDAVNRKENVDEYREVLGRYYDLEGTFTVMLLYLPATGGDRAVPEEIEYIFASRIRRFKTSHQIVTMKIGFIHQENYEILVINNLDHSVIPALRDIVFDVFRSLLRENTVHIGTGIEVRGLADLNKSYTRAKTAIRMAMYKNVPYVHFEDMGIFKILFSVKDDDLLISYADEQLHELEEYEKKHPGYMELLRVYIKNDRSLEKTAAELYLHRNTVNYRINKLKNLLQSPLKTVDDLFPLQIALAIRDMESGLSPLDEMH